MADPNDAEIREFVGGHLRSLHRDGGRVADLLDCSVGRILRRDMRRAGTMSIPIRPDMLAHVRDWLVASVRNDAFWLSRTDAEGRPLKLMKLGSIEACNAEADKAMRLEASRVLPMGLGPDDEAFERDAQDGYAFVRLLSAASLDLESNRMGHCIGNGGYDDMLDRRGHAFLSLRGPNGEPHATLELAEGERGWEIRQAQGRGNSRLAAAHRRRILGLLVDYGFPSTRKLRDGFWTHPGGVRPAGDVCALPPGSFMEGSVEFDGDEPFVLPDGLVVEGDLGANGAGLVALPRGLRIGGDLRLRGCIFLRSIPDDIEVGGAFVVEGCAVPEIVVPSGATSVDVSGRFPDVPLVRVVIPALDAKRVKVADAAELVVGSDLFVYELIVSACGTISFGSRVRVGEQLVVDAASRLDLPSDMVVAGEVDIRNVTGDVVVPEGWRSQGLDIQASGRVVLPDGISIGKDLVLRSMSMDRLPERMSVGRDLEMDDVEGVFPMPESASVRRSINIRRTAVTRFPENAKISGDLHLVDTALVSMPEGMSVAGDLVVDVSLGAVPRSARIRGRVVRAPRPRPDHAGTRTRRGAIGGNERILRLDRENEIRIERADPGFQQRLGRMHRSKEGTRIARNRVRHAGIGDVMAALRFRGHVENSGRRHGAVVDADGVLHAVGEIPEGVVVRGDLDFFQRDAETRTMGPRLPKDAFVSGSFRLVGLESDVLPDGLHVGGDLVVDAGWRTERTSLVLGGRVRVDGNLVLRKVFLDDGRPGCGIDVGGSAKLVSCLVATEVIVPGKPDPLRSISAGGLLDVSRSLGIHVPDDVRSPGGVRAERNPAAKMISRARTFVGHRLVAMLENIEAAVEKRGRKKIEGIVPLRDAVRSARNGRQGPR